MVAALRHVLDPRAGRTGTLAVFIAAVVSSAVAANPAVNLAIPCGGQRGTEFDVVIRGRNLEDAREILWYQPGIRVKSLEANPKKPGQLKARLALANDAALGLHDFRVRTATGLTNLHTFSVGPFVEVEETEPNNDLEHAQKAVLGVTVNGVIQAEDVDYFAVQAKKGQRINAEIEAVRLGLEFFDARLAIVNQKRFALSSSDNSTAAWKDALCSIIAPEDATYYIEVRESAFGGNGRCHYRLHVGDYPRPKAGYPAGGKIGQTVEVRWLADVAGPFTAKVRLPDALQADFGCPAQDARGTSPWPLPLRLSKYDNALETEPNDTADKATTFTAPAALNGILEKPGDVDCFKFAGKKGQVFDLRLFARTLRSPVDSILSVQRANGRQVAFNDDSNGPDSYLRLTCPDDDNYTVIVRDQLGHGGPAYVYRVDVTPVEPQLTLGLPEREAFEDIVAAVPRGNRTAFTVNAQREDFGGAVQLELKNLPQGVKAETFPIPDGQSLVPVVLAADEQAELSGALCDLLGRSTAGPNPIEGRLRQRSSLIRGQNNREVWNRYTQQMAVAVTEAVPFQIQIIAPKAPLVQSGSLNLRVVAQRKPGFDKPITLKMLYNPSGVSTTNSVTLPGDQKEALMPLTADAKAALGKWNIVVLGTAPVGDGPVTVATPVVPLEVAPPMLKLSFPVVNVEQGQSADLALAVQRVGDFKGRIKAELVGLPGEVTTTSQEFGPEVKDLVFPLKTTAKSPIGKHRSVICKATFEIAGETVTHLLGPGEIRIQKPLPPKTTVASAAPAPAKPAAPAEKRLSRLEQLRQNQAADKK